MNTQKTAMATTRTFLCSESLLLILILVFIPPLSITAISDCNNSSNTFSPLSTGASSSWTSPSKDFAFGFEHGQFKDPRFVPLLAIWFTKSPNHTIVWYAKPGREIPVESTVDITSNGIVMYDPDRREIWRRPNPENKSVLVSCASMQDSGNFVLRDKDGNIVWDSFGEPSDTLLPGQNLSKSQPVTLQARQSETNFSVGNFNLSWQPDGNLVLYYSQRSLGNQQQGQIQDYAYWSTGTFNSGSRLVFDEFGRIYVMNDSAIIAQVTNGIPGPNDYLYMARIEHDGVFRLYNYRKTATVATTDSCSSGWSVLEAIPDDICVTMIGENENFICGPNSYCVSMDGKPQCICPDHYSPFVQPNDPNNLTSCRPNFPPPSCLVDGWEVDPGLVDFEERGNMNWPFSDYDYDSGDFDKYACRDKCRDDCFCAAAVYNRDKENVAHCWKKKYPLTNGRYSTQTENQTTVFLKFRKVGSDNRDRSYVTLILSFLLGSSVFLNILLLLGFLGVYIFLRKRKILGQESVPSLASATVRSYAYKELEKATGGFKQILGRGAFGTVYKGVLGSDIKRYVAIKRLDKVVQEGEKEFKTEVSVIGQTHHRNLVRLLGYCEEGEHRLLVYEHMSNGSLANFLFGISRPHWNQRMQIALGIARGLTYLHEECSTQIIHCDIKPHNILLDELFTPRISDFGLAKLLLAEQTRAARSGLRGTIGYFAPEWFTKASITSKVDVYSFGVMLLELICCKSSVAFAMSDEEEALMDWAYHCYRHGKLSKLIENDEDAKNDIRRVEKHVMVAIWCVQEDPSLRPSMKKVTQMLEDVTTISLPPRPSMFSSASETSLSIVSF